MSTKLLYSYWQIVSKSVFLASIAMALASLGNFTTVVSRNQPQLQHQQVGNIARLVHDVDRIKNGKNS